MKKTKFTCIRGKSIDGDFVNVWVSRTLHDAFKGFPFGTKLKVTLEEVIEK